MRHLFSLVALALLAACANSGAIEEQSPETTRAGIPFEEAKSRRFVSTGEPVGESRALRTAEDLAQYGGTFRADDRFLSTTFSGVPVKIRHVRVDDHDFLFVRDVTELGFLTFRSLQNHSTAVSQGSARTTGCPVERVRRQLRGFSGTGLYVVTLDCQS